MGDHRWFRRRMGTFYLTAQAVVLPSLAYGLAEAACLLRCGQREAASRQSHLRSQGSGALPRPRRGPLEQSRCRESTEILHGPSRCIVRNTGKGRGPAGCSAARGRQERRLAESQGPERLESRRAVPQVLSFGEGTHVGPEVATRCGERRWQSWRHTVKTDEKRGGKKADGQTPGPGQTAL